MLQTTDAAIERLALRVIECSLPKREWTHQGHFAAALWLLRHRPDLAAPGPMRSLIRRYNDATGTPNTDSEGYHHTITLASLKAAAHHLRSHAVAAPLHEVLQALMASEHGRSDWLLAYWTRETLFGTTARHQGIEPDIRNLPF